MEADAKVATGELRVADVSRGGGGEDEGAEVLKSLSQTGNSRWQTAKFVVVAGEDGERNYDEDLVLCWVDPDDKLRHHYTYPVVGTVEHEEGTRVGDAFVAFLARRGRSGSGGTEEDDNKTRRPDTLADLTADARRTTSGAPSYRILFSYRLRRELDRRKHAHLVTFRLDDGSCTAVAALKDDDEYRIEARPPGPSRHCRLPPHDESWEIAYLFECPPVPDSSEWDKVDQKFYVWGDVDFDDYGPWCQDGCKSSLHGCKYNQIVPQVMIGNCVASSDDDYKFSWEIFEEWVLQAQYFWMTEEGTCRAICGEVVREVNPGDLLRTRIRYNCDNGSITASIAVVGGDGTEDLSRRSEIELQRPFPHDPTLFLNWRDFFKKCEGVDDKVQDEVPSQVSGCELQLGKRRGHGPLGRPCLNVEYKGRVSVQTLKSICPFIIKEAKFPGCASEMTSQWQTALFCPRLGRTKKLEDLEENHTLSLSEAIDLGGKFGGTKP